MYFAGGKKPFLNLNSQYNLYEEKRFLAEEVSLSFAT